MLSILSVFGLFIATSNAYILLYPIQAPIYTMPVSSKTVQAPSVPVNRIGPAIAPVVVNFADYDCSGGDGTYPDFESGCETYYVCSGDRVCISKKIRIIFKGVTTTLDCRYSRSLKRCCSL